MTPFSPLISVGDDAYLGGVNLSMDGDDAVLELSGLRMQRSDG